MILFFDLFLYKVLNCFYVILDCFVDLLGVFKFFMIVENMGVVLCFIGIGNSVLILKYYFGRNRLISFKLKFFMKYIEDD